MTPVGFWTDDAVTRLRSLWGDESLSARAIAIELGTTRNAVLGKAHRLNLADRSHTNLSLVARRIEVRRIVNKERQKPAPKSVGVHTRFFDAPPPMRPAGPEFKAPAVRAGVSKTSPTYRNQLGFLPDMTVRERRDMLAEAIRNTAALPVEG